MSYCLNPHCQKPENPESVNFCLNCGSRLQLKDRYRALKQIGEGGFGRTFIAEDADRLNARCLIKQFLPLPQVQQKAGLLEKAREMFAHEAYQLLQLGNHPQIPTLFADLEQEGCLYLVQEFIDGKNLLEELISRDGATGIEPNGHLTGEEIEVVLLDLLPVLQYIHDRDVIHRDIKPENIIRRVSDGKLVLIDFGVAKQLSGSVLLKTGTKLGTEGYAPIEQLRGGKAYPASDIYSLGVTCMHLLTGEEPDRLYDPMNGRWLWREELMQKGISIGSRLGRVLDKMLQEWVSDRYQSATEVISDLYWAMPVTTTSPTLPTNNNPTPTISQTWKCVHTLTSHSNYVIGVAISPDNRTLVSCSYDKTIKVWELKTGSLHGSIKAHTRWVSCIAISPDNQILASGSLDNTVKIWHLGSGNPIRTLEGLSGYAISLAMSPTLRGSKILAGGTFDKTINLWDVDTGNPIGVLKGHTGYIETLAIAPDGDTLASGGGFDDHTIRLWDLKAGSLIGTLAKHTASVRAVAFTPDGKTLVSGSEDQTIKIWDVSRGSLVRTLPKQADWVQAVAIHPNGNLLATGSRDSTINLWHLESGQLLTTLKWHAAAITSLAFSPDGFHLASASWDKTVKIWQAEEG